MNLRTATSPYSVSIIKIQKDGTDTYFNKLHRPRSLKYLSRYSGTFNSTTSPFHLLRKFWYLREKPMNQPSSFVEHKFRADI